MLSGHPKGLYRLFFIEMWERLAFYTMVGILLLYAIDDERGGLGLSRGEGNEIYGLYIAFVYFTPYLGGLLADRYLGYRRSVLIGGLLFASGFFLMSVRGEATFVTGLILLVCGNGFFKPNISAMVGNLYQAGDPKRDTGFNIFYMGINIGAFAANFLAAIMKNEFGWLMIFFAAGCGMVISVIILLSSWKVLAAADQPRERHADDTPFSDILLKVLGPSVAVGITGYLLAQRLPVEVTNLVRPSDIGFLMGSVPLIAYLVRLALKAEPEEKPGMLALIPIYIAGGTFFMVLHLNGSAMTTWARDYTDRQVFWAQADEEGNVPKLATYFAQEAFPGYYGNAGPGAPRPNRESLIATERRTAATMFGQKRMALETFEQVVAELPADVEAVRLTEDGAAVEGLPESAAEWEDLAFDVYEHAEVEETIGSHGETVERVTIDETARPLFSAALVRTLDDGRRFAAYLVTEETYRELYEGYREQYGQAPPELPPGKYLRTANPELYQSLNPFFVVFLTPLVVAFFIWRTRRGKPITTARKIFYGMVITAIAAGFMAAAGFATDNGTIKVSWLYLVAFYAIVTVGELCLSPMALSLVTKLSPKRFVGMTMGGWFLATAVGNKFSGFLGGLQAKLDPSDFFLLIVGAAALVAAFIAVLLPKLDAAIKKYGA